MRFLLLMVPAVCLSCSAVADGRVRFARDVRPILSDKCFSCHGPDQENRAADLRLDLEAEARARIGTDVESSELVARITAEDSAMLMPPADSHKQLTTAEIELLTRWVAQGAEWTGHWSFMPSTMPPIPDAADSEGADSEGTDSEGDGDDAIDSFIARRLADVGLQPAAAATREKLIRRVTFDLTGIPPTLDEINRFVEDRSAGAYERVVDRLLTSQRFGERMAVMWLDAARYGDTSVYHADGPRQMWAWRDAIVDAYNQNMPFDEFTINQLAGDLRPNPSRQQQILAGFNRNNATTDEGGAIAEEYRVEYAVDRVKTTATVWLALTMECAQCHEHKYDPISQREYYEFYAFFNVSRDQGMQTREGNAEPKIDLLRPEQEAKIPSVEQQLAAVRQQLSSIEAECEADLHSWIGQQRTESEGSGQDKSRIIHLPISEGDGVSVHDQASERDLTLSGKASWVESPHNWGLRFRGSGSIDLGDIGNFQRSDPFSYGGWCKPGDQAGGAILARMDDQNKHRGYDLYLAGGRISVHLIHSWPDSAIKVTTNKMLEPDQWSHIFATYDGSGAAAGIRIYVNGELWDWKIEQDALTGSIQTDKNLLVGSRHPGSKLKGTIDEISVYDRQLSETEVALLAQGFSLRSLLSLPEQKWTDQQRQAVRHYYLTTQHAGYQDARQQIKALEQQLDRLREPMTSVMIMADMEQPRETFVLRRGAYDSPTETKVEPGTPSALPPMNDDLPRNRLGLAKWLFQDNHPLTARVAVNRYWQMLFGRGLVTTPEDFGGQGQFPTHPELLDYLAVDFRQSGWDIKRMIKQMVTSRTYRQTSEVSVDAYRADPLNHYLARGSRFRLQGEFIRDTVLQLSGLLVDRLGGPGVKPYQPAGLWQEVGLGGKPIFQQDHGDRLYRRSLYTYWKRSAPPPSMQIFDAPTREKCTVNRPRTNTPLQALVTLNDPQFVEASRHFAERILQHGGDAANERIDYAIRLATARAAGQNEQRVLQGILAAALRGYAEDTESANSLLSVGESLRDLSLDPVEHAAWTIVANTILNLDETLTRE